jgi:hypothetical protein
VKARATGIVASVIASIQFRHFKALRAASLKLVFRFGGPYERLEARLHGDLRRLEYDFPGFASLVKDLRSWKIFR